MKEVSIEQKAKKYDEAFERVKELLSRCRNNMDRITMVYRVNDIESIFPELKKSEDEKIKEDLIQWISEFPDMIWRGHYKKDVIAWLEKQGKQKPTLPKWKYKNDNTPLLRDSLILNKYGCVAKSPSGAFVNDVWVIDYDELAKLPKEELEKQGELPELKESEDKEIRKDIISNLKRYINCIKDGYDAPSAKDFVVKDVKKQIDWLERQGEQKALWRKEIEQACISGGDAGYLLTKDPRYRENLGVKEVDLEKEYEEFVVDDPIFGYFITNDTIGMKLAKHFFELGLKAQKGE